MPARAQRESVPQGTAGVESQDCLKKGRSPPAAVHQISSDSSPTLAGTLPPEQAQVIAALTQGATVTQAAAAAGLHRTTIHHWLRTSPAFKTALEHARREFAAHVEDSLIELSAAALSTLQKLLEDAATPPAVRLKAALAVLQRPRFPNPGWQLPAEIGTRQERDLMHELAAIEADYKRLRIEDAIQRPKPAAANVQPARNAPCPCGSGLKYKRCCGPPAAPQRSP